MTELALELELELEVELELKDKPGGKVLHPDGTDIRSASLETVPPNAKALPTHVTLLPMVMPELSILVPKNVELAPNVVAAVGVHQTSQAEAPPDRTTMEFAEVVKAPSMRKIYVPLPTSVIVPPPAMLVALSAQYTPGGYVPVPLPTFAPARSTGPEAKVKVQA